jgi:GR25 family glycosyltransferase involved in LPS biosynthesis
MKLFCVHWKKLTDRKKSIIEQFGEHVIFVDKYDRRDVETPEKIIEKFPEMDPWINSAYVRDDTHVFSACNAMSHIHCFKEIAYGDDDWGVVIEDDAIKAVPNMDFEKHVKELVKGAPSKWDLLCINDGTCAPGMFPKLILGAYDRYWLRVAEPRQTSGYIVSKVGAKKILEFFEQKNAIQNYQNCCLDNLLGRISIYTTFKQNIWNLPTEWISKFINYDVYIWWTIRPLLHDGSHWEQFEQSH